MNSSVLAVAVTISLVASFTHASILKYSVNPANGHKYALLNNSTWTDAAAEALSLGGYLATVRSQAENDWLFIEFSNFGGIGRALYIGLNDRQTEGSFVWQSGETSAYRNWSQSQPDAFNVNQDFVCIIPRNNWYSGAQVRKWDDFNNYVTFGNTTMNGVVELLPPACPADLNGDNAVDDSDFILFLNAYNILDCADTSMAPLCPSDFTLDHFVDDSDFLGFVVAYNALVCPL